MRRTTTTIIAAMLTASTVFAQAGEPDKPGLLKRLFGTLSWKERIRVVDTPRAAVHAASQHVQYTPDLIDRLTPPQRPLGKRARETVKI